MTMELIKPKDAADWWTLILAALFTIIVIVGPIYVASQVNEDTGRIVEILERQNEAAQRRAVRLNVLTITCVSRLSEDERTDEALRRCIEEGLLESSAIEQEEEVVGGG